jgi:predicted small metal-binding protein
MKLNHSFVASVCTLALALAPLALRAEEKGKAEETKSKEPMYVVACPAPCDFSVKSHDKTEVVAVVKEHAKSHHNMQMTDKEVEDMIKTKAPKKD